jgi:hypothetical protein
MSLPEPDSTPLPLEAKVANRSANLGCLVVTIALFILFFSFALGGYSAYRLNQYREELILQHLGKALIPKIELESVPAEQAFSQLKEMAVQADPWFKNVQFKLYTERDLKDASRPVSPGLQKPITLHLQNIPAINALSFYASSTGGSIQIIDGSVNLLPANETLEPRKLLSLKQVEPDFWKSSPLVKAESPAEFWDVQPLLASEGLPFLPRTYARYYPDQKRLEISNLKANNAKISAWLQEKKIIPDTGTK